MNNNFEIITARLQMQKAQQEFAVCNKISQKFGLSLSPQQMTQIVQARFTSLKHTGRVEFGDGVIKKLVYAFCDSPYVNQSDYTETLTELQDIFYYYKNETYDLLSDDELIEVMNIIFNKRAHGSLEFMRGISRDILLAVAEKEKKK